MDQFILKQLWLQQLYVYQRETLQEGFLCQQFELAKQPW